MKHLVRLSWIAAVLALSGVCAGASEPRDGAVASSGWEPRGSNPAELRAAFDPATGLPVAIETHVNGRTRRWFVAPATLSVRKETTGASASPTRGKAGDGTAVRAALAPLGLIMTSRWTQDGPWLVWDLDFNGDVPRSGHTVQLDLPVLDPR